MHLPRRSRRESLCRSLWAWKALTARSGRSRTGPRGPGESVTFYTRGVNRVSSFGRNALNESTGMIFAGGDRIWRNFQRTIAATVNDRGGLASVQPPVVVRPDWNQVGEVERKSDNRSILFKYK